MTRHLPVVGCWIREPGANRLAQVVGHLAGNRISVTYGDGSGPVTLSDWECGIQPGFVVQDSPISNARRTLGVGTAIAVRRIADWEQVSVQLHATGELRWLPFERLRRIMDPKLQFIRAEQHHADSAERTALNLMGHALRTWNEATGALERLDVDPLPHQITLVHRILGSGNCNWLIADDVGLGKTIEVGLLLGALDRRQNLHRVLVVVPSGLTQQWKEELAVKFGQKFRIYGKDFEVSSAEEWGLYNRVIVSLDLAKPMTRDDDGSDFATRFGKLSCAGTWDLVVVDEAHRLSRDDAGRATLRFRLAQMLRAKTDSLLLLTGTPHQGDVGKFQNLLRLVRPELEKAIAEIEEDATFIGEVILRNHKIDAVDLDGNFLFKGVRVNRVEIDPSPAAHQLEVLLSNYLRRGYGAGDRDGGTRGRAIGFVMTIYRKLASSSIYALVQAMRRRRQRLLGAFVPAVAEGEFEDQIEDRDDLDEADGRLSAAAFFDEELEAIDAIIAQARICVSQDKKLSELCRTARAVVHEQGQKLLIFTEYRATQHYLAAALKLLFGIPPALIHGGMSVEEKQEAIATFESTAPVLISTEAGGEGLNLHRRCHIMVNYDLPWNPARLSQRIGRLYRYGQQRQVVVLNFLSRDTIDSEILSKVLVRLEAVVRHMATTGGGEFNERYSAEILGELLERIDIADLLDEARSGPVQRTDERIHEAIESARRAKSLQDDILSAAGSMEPGGWQLMGRFSTADLACFIRRAAAKLDIAVVPAGDNPEYFDLRLPDSLKGRFAEFGRRTNLAVRTSRDALGRDAGRMLLDFSSSFVRYLVSEVTAPEFGGGYGCSGQLAVADRVCAAVLVHYQNEQGEPRGLEMMAAERSQSGQVVVDNAVLRVLFEKEQKTIAPADIDARTRCEVIEALLDRAEIKVAENCGPYRYANGIFPLAAIELRSAASGTPAPEPLLSL
jgi:superfamily II DNA or RNA helicase